MAMTAALAVVAVPSVSEACGEWTLHRGQGAEADTGVATVYVHTVQVGRKSFRVKHTDAGYEATVGKKPWATFTSDELRRKGKLVGRLDGDKLTVWGREYVIVFGPLVGDHPRPYFATLSVFRGDKEVFASPRVMSFSFCGRRPMTRAERRRDVLARLAFILLRRPDL